MSRLMSIFILVCVLGFNSISSANAAGQVVVQTIQTVTELQTIIKSEQGLSAVQTLMQGFTMAQGAEKVRIGIALSQLAPGIDWKRTDQKLAEDVLAKFRASIGDQAKAKDALAAYDLARSKVMMANIKAASTGTTANRGSGVTGAKIATVSTAGNAVLKWAATMVNTSENLANGLDPANALSQDEFNQLSLVRDELGEEVGKCLLELSADSSFANLCRTAIAGLGRKGMPQFLAMAEKLGQLNGAPEFAMGDLRSLADRNKCGLINGRHHQTCMGDLACSRAPSRLDAAVAGN